MSSIDRAAYRARQFFRGISAQISQAECGEAGRVLGPRLYPLFASMQAADQRHCLDVFERLTAGGCSDEEMLQAALIHDAGKGRISGAPIGVHHRVLFVLLQPLPGAVNWLAKYDGGMRSLRDHDRRTVELAEEFGAPEGVIRLLKAMHGGAVDERAGTLTAADDLS